MSRSTRTLLVFTLSLVVAGIFSALVYQAGQRTPAAADIQSVPVAVAARALPVGSKLTAADVKLVQWPASSPIAGAITSVEAAVDRGLGLRDDRRRLQQDGSVGVLTHQEQFIRVAGQDGSPARIGL